jgi:hypothetical protein
LLLPLAFAASVFPAEDVVRRRAAGVQPCVSEDRVDERVRAADGELVGEHEELEAVTWRDPPDPGLGRVKGAPVSSPT